MTSTAVLKLAAPSSRLPASPPPRFGPLTARTLGDAALTGRHDPRTVKYVWHYIARFAAPSG